jgi:hypothetical protein
MADVLVHAVEACLAKAQEVANGLPGPLSAECELDEGARLKLQWIDRQIQALMAKLSAIQQDLESGLSLPEMGFSDASELADWLVDIGVELQHLKAQALAIAQGRAR